MKWVAIALAVLVLAGGVTTYLVFFAGETNQEVLDRYRAKFDAKRMQLKTLAAKLPPLGSVKENMGRKDLDPKPAYDPRNKNFNCSGLLAAQMLDPDHWPETPNQVDLNLYEGLLLMHLQWTGPKNPMAVTGQRARAGLAEELEGSLRQPYLLVYRAVRYDPPVIVNENQFIGGDVDLEGFLLDQRIETVVASVRVRAKAAEVVSAVKGRGREFVYSSMMTKLRESLGQAVNEATGGNFDLKFNSTTGR